MYITSLLDVDLYKFTMMLFAYKMHPNVNVEYAFKCRSKVNINHLLPVINRELDNLCELVLEKDELKYLIKTVDDRFDDPSFYYFNLDRNAVTVSIDSNNQLDIRVKGIWWRVILFEIYILAIVNQANSEFLHNAAEIKEVYKEGRKILNEKVDFLTHTSRSNKIKIMEFGTRRRFNLNWQTEVLDTLLNNTENIIGTSNVLLAKNYGITPMGTMAHECFQVMQGVYHPVKSQSILLWQWKEFWGKKYLYALTDIFPTFKFLHDFTSDLAKMYLGLRHDSGEPIEWGEQMISMYDQYGINPKHKSLTFSDGLDVYDTLPLVERFSDRIDLSFGIGTKLTNDFGKAHDALQIVMKIVRVDGLDVAKLSNNPEKSMCENKLYTNWLMDAIKTDSGVA